MKTFIILLLSCSSLFAGETFVSLASGETNRVSYGLSYLVSDSWSGTHMSPSDDHSDLFLTLRNDGAKSMSFGEITAEDFSVRDAGGEEMTVYLRTSPQDVKGVQYGETCVIHLIVMMPHARELPQPWTFHFKTKPGEFTHQLDLTITGIKLRKHETQ
jgi:hypothetical protein